MTPAARGAAAIELFDQISAGTPAEAALTRWARANRYAGSKDRAAIRDLVFDGLRHWRSDVALGGGTDGRARLLGRLRALGDDVDAIFSGEKYAPSSLTEAERGAGGSPVSEGDHWDLPDWILPEFKRSLGDAADQTAMALRARAPVTIRANVQRIDVEVLANRLAQDGITVRPNALSPDALTATDGERRLRATQSFADGLFEFQDASSQAVVAGLPNAQTALDYCAGGGGKALAMAARGMRVSAHDAAPERMRDIPARAKRAGTPVSIWNGQTPRAFDIVLVDAPCSGSGAWRRAPDGKWRFTEDDLDRVTGLQLQIAVEASEYVAQNGLLAYATCSVLRRENEDQVDEILRRLPAWSCTFQQRFAVCDDGDGFFVAHFRRAQ